MPGSLQTTNGGNPYPVPYRAAGCRKTARQGPVSQGGQMVLSAQLLLVIVSMVLAIVSFFDNRYPVLNIAVFLLALALIVR